MLNQLPQERISEVITKQKHTKTYKSFSELPASLNVSDVASALSVSLSAAYVIVRQGDFPKVRLTNSSKISIPKDAFIAWVENHLPELSLPFVQSRQEQKKKILDLIQKHQWMLETLGDEIRHLRSVVEKL